MFIVTILSTGGENKSKTKNKTKMEVTMIACPPEAHNLTEGSNTKILFK